MLYNKVAHKKENTFCEILDIEYSIINLLLGCKFSFYLTVLGLGTLYVALNMLIPICLLAVTVLQQTPSGNFTYIYFFICLYMYCNIVYCYLSTWIFW